LGFLSIAGTAHPAPPPEVALTGATWSEEFESLKLTDWQVQLYSFPASGCNMLESHVAVAGSRLVLRVDRNPDARLPKPFNGGEVGSTHFFKHGLFVVRMKPALARGGVSAFFLMNRWQPENWEHREIDIEFLGNKPRAVQLTTHDFQNGGRDWKSASATLDLGFEATADFHEYAILWTKDRVEWFVDRRLVHRETRYVPPEPLQIRMNVYMGDVREPGIAQWLGPVDESTLPATAEYEWVNYFPLDALPVAYTSRQKE
jgi:endo-1,3-1,4-beta-glycanase ExoK